MYVTVTDSPIGKIWITSTNEYILSISFGELQGEVNSQIHILSQAKAELEEYFLGKRKTFTVPFLVQGTSFQKEVWNYLTTIPYGQTRSYLDVACGIYHPKAVRAIGQANRNNLLPIVIPCHRVIGKNGALIGYAGKEIEKKKYLLDLESRDR